METKTKKYGIVALLCVIIIGVILISGCISKCCQTNSGCSCYSTPPSGYIPCSNETCNSEGIQGTCWKLPTCCPLNSSSKTYTLDADFDEGTLVNVVHDPSDQLQLADTTEPFNFIWIAVSTKGTVVKIDTQTGAVLGEYRTTPQSQLAGDPSRTTVDKDGSVWVTNRNNVYDGWGSVVHIGLEENGQCEDRNGNGVIDTSTGLGDVRSWTDTSGARGVATAADECIVHYTKVNSQGTRHVSVDANNDLWVSGIGVRNFDLIKGGRWDVPGSGSIIRSEISVVYGGYGGLIDPNGVIWSSKPLLRWDTSLPLTGPNGGNWKGYSHNSYGLCIDSQGNVWNTEYGWNIRKFDPAGNLIGTFNHGFNYAQGCVVDSNDHVWVAQSSMGNTVGHLLNDGTYIGMVTVGSGPTGVAVDAAGKIWATNYNSETASRIDPTAGSIGANGVTRVGAVDFTTVNLGGNLYDYSDMTGSTLIGAPDNGMWTVVYDSGITGANWGIVSWNSLEPGDSSIVVTAASSSSNGINFGPTESVTDGVDLTVADGRYLKVSVSFTRSSNSDSDGDGTNDSPILYDLTVTLNWCCNTSVPVCPNGCVCMTQLDATASGYTTRCNDQSCGANKWCWNKTIVVSPCPPSCNCSQTPPQGHYIDCHQSCEVSPGVPGKCYSYSQPLNCTGVNCSCYASNPGSNYTSCNQTCSYGNGYRGECWKPGLSRCPIGCECSNTTASQPPFNGATSCNQSCPLGISGNGTCWKPCSSGCTCLTLPDAIKKGYNVSCNNQSCQFLNGASGTCWNTSIYNCTNGCTCLPPGVSGGISCGNQSCPLEGHTAGEIIIGKCWRNTSVSNCTNGCLCMTPAAAAASNLTVSCSNISISCPHPIGGGDIGKCWRNTSISNCPLGCECFFSMSEAASLGYTQNCNASCTLKVGISGRCWSKPVVDRCPSGCKCFDTALIPNGYITCSQKCPLDSGAIGECWKPQSQSLKCTGVNCSCYASDPGSGYTSCDEKCTLTSGATGTCWKNTIPVCPNGCPCLTTDEAKQKGYTTLCSNQTCSSDGRKWCWNTSVPAACPVGCACMTQPDANKKGFTISCNNQLCPLPNGVTGTCWNTSIYNCTNNCTCLPPGMGISGGVRCGTQSCPLAGGVIGTCWKQEVAPNKPPME